MVIGVVLTSDICTYETGGDTMRILKLSEWSVCSIENERLNLRDARDGAELSVIQCKLIDKVNDIVYHFSNGYMRIGKSSTKAFEELLAENAIMNDVLLEAWNSQRRGERRCENTVGEFQTN